MQRAMHLQCFVDKTGWVGSWELFDLIWSKVLWDILPPKIQSVVGPWYWFLRCRGVGTMWDEDLSHILAWTCRDPKITMGQRAWPDEDLVAQIFYKHVSFTV